VRTPSGTTLGWRWRLRLPAPGAPCPACTANDSEAPRMPSGFTAQFDKKGWRHLRSEMAARVRRSDRPGRWSEARDAPGCRDLHHQTAKARTGDLEIWQIAVEHLLRAAETGGAWLMLARIGVLKALHRGVVREFNPDRKVGQAEAEAGRIGAHGVAAATTRLFL
jgi:hypothetical protein